MTFFFRYCYYTESFFAERDIRYIAINDSVDSDKGDNDFTPFRNLFNDLHARDTSKKIRSKYKSNMGDCTMHVIREETLKLFVRQRIFDVTARLIDNADDFRRMVQKQRFDETEKAVKRRKKELKQAKKRIAELDRIFKRIYEDNITGAISHERFLKLSAEYGKKAAVSFSPEARPYAILPAFRHVSRPARSISYVNPFGPNHIAGTGVAPII